MINGIATADLNLLRTPGGIHEAYCVEYGHELRL